MEQWRMILAYDHGLEHGPVDFNHYSIKPEYILNLAQIGGFDAIVLQKGLAEYYYDQQLPLVIKLNGKTSLKKGDPVSRQICSVQEAKDLGASAVGYTVYLGSKYEPIMLRELGSIEEEAEELGLPVIGWMYGKADSSYSARVGLEMGLDAVKIKADDKLALAMEAAGEMPVYVSGGNKTTHQKFLENARNYMEIRAYGIIAGRNIWQHKDPLAISKDLRKIIYPS